MTFQMPCGKWDSLEPISTQKSLDTDHQRSQHRQAVQLFNTSRTPGDGSGGILLDQCRQFVTLLETCSQPSPLLNLLFGSHKFGDAATPIWMNLYENGHQRGYDCSATCFDFQNSFPRGNCVFYKKQAFGWIKASKTLKKIFCFEGSCLPVTQGLCTLQLSFYWKKHLKDGPVKKTGLHAQALFVPTVTGITHSGNKSVLALKASYPDWLCEELNRAQFDIHWSKSDLRWRG